MEQRDLLPISYEQGLMKSKEIGAANFIHNVQVTGQDIKYFMESEKPNLEAFKKAIFEGIKAYQQASQQPGNLLEGPRSTYLYGPIRENFRALPGPEYRPSLGGSSSSSSQGPVSYGPDAPPPTAQRAHGTGLVSYDSIKEWMNKGGNKQFLYDQLTKREGYGQFLNTVDAKGYNKNDPELAKKVLKMTNRQLAEILLELDGKEVK